MSAPTCAYSEVLYRHPLLNAQILLVGVLVVCPSRHWGVARFELRRACEPIDSPSFRRLRTQAQGFTRYPPMAYTDLEALYEHGPLGRLSFTEPTKVDADPEELLQVLEEEALTQPLKVQAWHILYQHGG